MKLKLCTTQSKYKLVDSNDVEKADIEVESNRWDMSEPIRLFDTFEGERCLVDAFEDDRHFVMSMKINMLMTTY